MTDIWTERRGPWFPHEKDARGPFDVDYARVIHSTSFRRLQGKTQIHNIGDGDFYRTRLTHSLEVAQIAGGVMQHLEATSQDHPAHPYLPPKSLIQTAGFGHDLGHPPFGHGGETALNYCMREAGGFEGNGQTLRILGRLEHFSDTHGSNLTRRALLALLKYPVPYSMIANPNLKPRLVNGDLDQAASQPPKCFLDTETDTVNWILEPLSAEDRDIFQKIEMVSGAHGRPKHKSFDCSIMDVADDIAYGVHDLEDAIALDFIGEDTFRQYVTIEACHAFLESIRCDKQQVSEDSSYDLLMSDLFGSENSRKRVVGRMVNHFITHVGILASDAIRAPLIRYRARIAEPQARFLEKLKSLVRDR